MNDPSVWFFVCLGMGFLVATVVVVRIGMTAGRARVPLLLPATSVPARTEAHEAQTRAIAWEASATRVFNPGLRVLEFNKPDNGRLGQLAPARLDNRLLPGAEAMLTKEVPPR